jgi:anaerobic ribonucleoside-triphosphate reductase activating protein
MATDVLVDGPFVRELRNIDLRFRGSSNQRLIDVRRTFDAGKIIVLPEE